MESNKGKLDKVMWGIKEEEKDASFGIKEEFLVPSLFRYRMGVRKGGGLSPAQLLNCGTRPVFTGAQLVELQHQTLIYQHLVTGLPVPHEFVLPIWESVASSLGLSDVGMHQLYPSFPGLNPSDFYSNFTMDLEPGRCRRSDGKKWRCNKQVVGDRKYCERHLYRGRYGSRKLVETSKTGTSFVLPTPNIATSDGLNTKLSISVPAPLSSPCRSPPNTSNTSNKKVASFMNGAIDMKAISNSEAKEVTKFGDSKGFFSTAAGTTSKKIKIEEFDDGTNYVYNHPILSNNVSKIRNCESNSVSYSLYTGSQFSPEAVNRVSVPGSKNSCSDYKSYTDSEPGRCRRTDGKKWQCKNNVVAGEKYCISHMHRGAKRYAGAFSTEFSAGSPARINKIGAFLYMDTKLSIGIPENLQVNFNEEKSSSSSTISDTISTATTPGQSSTSRMISAFP